MKTKKFSKFPYVMIIIMMLTLGLGSEAFGQTPKSNQKPTQAVTYKTLTHLSVQRYIERNKVKQTKSFQVKPLFKTRTPGVKIKKTF